MAKITKGDMTKRAIFACAMSLFQEKGYDNVTISQIVEAAGIAKGTFYIYYKTKSAVLMEMIHQYDNYYESLTENFTDDMSATDCLCRLARGSGELTTNAIGLDSIRALYVNQVNGSLTNQLSTERSLYHLMADLIRRGMDRGEFAAVQLPEHLTNMLLASLRGIYYEWIMRSASFSLADRCEELTRLFCRGISAQSEKTPASGGGEFYI